MKNHKLVFILFFLLFVPLQTQSFLGSGSYVDPYRISSCDDFNNINMDVSSHYVLVNNLYCDELFVEYFNGSLDGVNYVLEVNNSDFLFGLNEGLIIDLNINFLNDYKRVVDVDLGYLINVKVLSDKVTNKFNDFSNSIGTFSVPISNWQPVITLPPPYNEGVVLAMSVFVDNEIFILGGRVNNNEHLKSVKVFNVDSQTWRLSVSDMLVESSGVGAVHYDGKIYVIGRYAGSELQIYDIASDTWSFGEDMPSSRFDFSSAALNGKIYVFGGGEFITKDQNSTKSLFIYDIENDSWSEGPSMPIARQGHYGVGVFEDKIYVFGGNNESWGYPVQLDIFDTNTNNWSRGADLPFGFAYHGVASVGDYIYAVGGYNFNNDVSGETFRYDPINDSWVVFNDSLLKVTEYSLNAGFFDLYAVGGYKYIGGGYEISNRLYKLELEKPKELEIFSPVNTIYPNSELLVNISLYEHISNVSYEYKGFNYSYNESINLSFLNGSNTLNVFGYDKYRGFVSSSVSFVVDNITPYIDNYSVSPLGVVKGEEVVFEVYGKGDLFVNITYDNNTETVSLNNGTNSYLTNSSFVGKYFLEFFSNDSFSRFSEVVNSSFESFKELEFNESSFVFNGTITYYYNGQELTNIIDAMIDIGFEQEEYNLFFVGVNLTNSSITINTTNTTEYPFILVVNSNLDFNESIITINTTNLNITSPIKLFKCDNFTNNTCTTNWYELSFTIENNMLTFNTTNFSAFGLKTVPAPVSDTTSTTRRGGGGGFSIPIVASCVSSWSCEGWSECVDGVQTRVCMVEELCESDDMPEQSRSCVEEEIEDEKVLVEEPIEESEPEVSYSDGLPTGYVVSFNLEESNSLIYILLFFVVLIMGYYSFVIYRLITELHNFKTFDKSKSLFIKVLSDIMSYRSSNNILFDKKIDVILEGDKLTILLAKINSKKIIRNGNIKNLKFVESDEYKLEIQKYKKVS